MPFEKLIQLIRPESMGIQCQDPVEREWRTCQRILTDRPRENDSILGRYFTYLEFARRFSLRGQAIVDSCFDLALTLDPFFAEEERRKIILFEEKRRAALQIIRPPRVITMQLYPKYFEAILRGRKPFEGRAYDPESEKRYEAIRPGDNLVFNVCKEKEGWEDECRDLGLESRLVMELTVKEIFFAPRVHWMYEFCDCVGAEFQPMVNGPSELLELQRAAVYYQIPGYKGKIRDYGFVGIKVENPRIISSPAG